MKPIQNALIICRNPEQIKSLSNTLRKNGVEVINCQQEHNLHITYSKQHVDLVITCIDNNEHEWTALKELADSTPMLFLTPTSNITSLGPDFADAWLSLEDADELLYKAAVKAVKRRKEQTAEINLTEFRALKIAV